ncbi:hypothetical protein [Thiorhodococcus mannitoliphagus]|uniref:hypothetical protein n=1 Tax=Thiorhodococcus mannitoliphagus TaxID=329406 RepID=UPI001F0D21BA|nr:hypothetical protein [Thiorhodococcus mannitoliphagus]
MKRIQGSSLETQPTVPTTRPWLIGLIIWLTLSPISVFAEITVSGFGTLGGAVSDQDFIYQRYIDGGGTLNPDSLIGLQLDANLSDAWRVTLQGTFAPATDDENVWKPTLTWAFLSWRPSNDLLLRAGKLRLPLLLYSANSDVGITFDFARLPTEVYSLLPTTDVTGLSFSKTWLDGDREWTLEGYLGRANTEWRYYLHEGIEPDFPAGSLFLGFEMDMVGLVASLRNGENLYRIGLHRADATADYGPLPQTFHFVSILPGMGYYQVADGMPGPGLPKVDTLEIYVATLGAEIALPRNFRLVGEYGRRRISNATMGPDTSAAYLALLKDAGRWTPYVYWAYIRSSQDALNLAEALNDNRVPDSIPGAAAINASQRAGSDLLSPFDQQSLAVGTSFNLSPTSKIKVEWNHTRTGRLSSFVDAPTGEDSGGRQINVFSLSYNLAF